MPQAADQPAKHGRSLTGFYIAIGVLAALVGLGAWLWRPMQVLYLERAAGRFQGRVEASYCAPATALAGRALVFPNPHDEAAAQAAEQLAEMGPVAYPALARLARNPQPQVRALAMVALGMSRADWAADLMIEGSKDRELGVAEAGIFAMAFTCRERLATAEHFSGEGMSEAQKERARQAFLAWWEREGKVKCGEGKK